jgi:hypothetical protein
MDPFHPVDDATTTIAASTASVRGAIKKRPTGEFQIRIHNAAAALAFYRIGDSTVVATNTDIPLPAGALEVVTVMDSDATPETHVAAILASGTGSIYITSGAGL